MRPKVAGPRSSQRQTTWCVPELLTSSTTSLHVHLNLLEGDAQPIRPSEQWICLHVVLFDGNAGCNRPVIIPVYCQSKGTTGHLQLQSVCIYSIFSIYGPSITHNGTQCRWASEIAFSRGWAGAVQLDRRLARPLVTSRNPRC